MAAAVHMSSFLWASGECVRSEMPACSVMLKRCCPPSKATAAKKGELPRCRTQASQI